MTGTCQSRHRHQEFLRFLKQVARAYPDVELHLVMDNYAAHKRVEIRDWLEANPFRSVTELTAKIRAFIDGWNNRAHPFVWTKTAEQILTKANRQNTSVTAQ